MKMLEEIRILIVNFLNIIIISNPYIFLNFWSFIHLMVGVGIMYLFLNRKIPTPFLFLFMILVGWEVIEYAFYTSWFTHLFLVETTLDSLWDVIIGMLGGTVVYFSKWKKKQ